MRNPSPISTSSPRLSTISLPGASVRAVNSSAAALLLTTCTPPAVGTARASAASAPRPRRARRPVARSNSTSVVPPAATTASSAARDSGARPRLVCTTTPVALTTGRRLDAVAGSAATACSATRSGSISPARARCWASAITDFTSARPSTRCGFGQARIGEQDVGAGHSPARVTHVGSEGAWRRRTGIEPASGSVCRSTVLKTAPVTRPDTPPWTMATIVAAFTPRAPWTP